MKRGVITIDDGSDLSTKKQKKDFDCSCPICMNPYIAEIKIFQCVQGHSICENCYNKLKNTKDCPTCRSGYNGTRNYDLENMCVKESVPEISTRVCPWCFESFQMNKIEFSTHIQGHKITNLTHDWSIHKFNTSDQEIFIMTLTTSGASEWPPAFYSSGNTKIFLKVVGNDNKLYLKFGIIDGNPITIDIQSDDSTKMLKSFSATYILKKCSNYSKKEAIDRPDFIFPIALLKDRTDFVLKLKLTK